MMKTKEKQNLESQGSLALAYTAEQNRVLDPELLDKTAMERLPVPTGYRVLVMPYKGRAKTEGGIILTDETRDRNALATVVCYVLKLGPDCYTDSDKYSQPYCKEKDWVVIGRYAGSRFRIEGAELRLLNDDEILATILDPDDIAHV
jgi:co-chaperonin GroES (HSP10)|tara:strand:+ start:7724 stop:8164 length:441 start_codon:yes stop_codon:yes gene_type:complete